MRVWPALFAFYIQASFHVSLSLIALLVFTWQLFGIPIAPAYCGALFFGSVAGYNAIKFGAEPWKYRKSRGSVNRAIFRVSLGSALLALALLARLEVRTWLLLGLSCVIAALYALPVMPGFRNLRSFGLLKIGLVALVWTLVSLWIPLWGHGVFREGDLLVEGFQRLLWVSLLMLPFEVRDMPFDPPALRTLPRRLGLGHTRLLGWAGAALFAATTLLKANPAEGELLVKGAAALLTGLGIQFCREGQSPYYASFWIEAIPLAVVALYAALGWAC